VITSVGDSVSARVGFDERDLDQWRAAVMAYPDVVRLLANGDHNA
jgi:hypothetical protein